MLILLLHHGVYFQLPFFYECELFGMLRDITDLLHIIYIYIYIYIITVKHEVKDVRGTRSFVLCE